MLLIHRASVLVFDAMAEWIDAARAQQAEKQGFFLHFCIAPGYNGGA